MWASQRRVAKTSVSSRFSCVCVLSQVSVYHVCAGTCGGLKRVSVLGAELQLSAAVEPSLQAQNGVFVYSRDSPLILYFL